MEEAKKIKCPSCKSFFKLDEMDEEGDIIFCLNCDAELEIKSIEPPKAELAKHDSYLEDCEDEDEEDAFGYDDEDEHEDSEEEDDDF